MKKRLINLLIKNMEKKFIKKTMKFLKENKRFVIASSATIILLAAGNSSKKKQLIKKEGELEEAERTISRLEKKLRDNNTTLGEIIMYKKVRGGEIKIK